MKNKIYLLMLPFIFIFSGMFIVSELWHQGSLEGSFWVEKVRPKISDISTAFTDLKFKARGARPHKNKIVIVEVDNQSLELIGRWPWHRNAMAEIIETLVQYGVKGVGLDVVFSEPDVRFSKELEDRLAPLLPADKLQSIKETAETDFELARTIERHSDKVVTAWTTDTSCRPRFDGEENCPAGKQELYAEAPKSMEKFLLPAERATGFDLNKTPLFSFFYYIANLEMYNQVSKHSGYFNAFQDPDGYIRRSALVMLHNGRPAPSLPLAMAQLALDDQVQVKLDHLHQVESLTWAKSGKRIPVSPGGVAEINFRGPVGVFDYVSVVDLVSAEDKLQDVAHQKLTGKLKSEVFKDALVLIGPTALGVYDLRPFPFSANAPGVDGHATILDNLLSNDFLVRGGGPQGWIFMLGAMILGGLVYSLAVQRLGAVHGLIVSVGFFLATAMLDYQSFSHNVNWDSGFFYLQNLAIFIATNAIKYVLEERDKKFVRGAFAKYVAPAVVDSILKDPAKLTVGGEKRDLTIMFSDIRSFTTFSEQMDAKALASFLNDYLGIMTNIVFSKEGTLDKYIGDAIMAFWGAPLDQPLHASNACKAARLMMQALAENKQRFKDQYNVDVNIGIGINTGMVSVGNMGSSNNFAYTVIGDHVNLSSRLEGLTKAYGVAILTTRFTFDSIAETQEALPPHRVLDHVKVKGKKNAVELIQVLDREMSAEGLQLFEEARTLYSHQKWEEAATRFEKANRLLAGDDPKGDGPSQEYLQRCKDFSANPPGADWDGSWEMHSK